MSTEHFDALRGLIKALNNFLNTGWQSEGSSGDDPRAGMDPNDLDVDAVEPGGAVHDAVCLLQPFYQKRIDEPAKLPAPEARTPWIELQNACRHEKDPCNRQIKAHEHAGALRDWAEGELVRLGPDYSINLVGNMIDDPTGPLSAKQIAKIIWGKDDEAARKRAREWMQNGKLPANKANKPADHYIVSKATLNLLRKAEHPTSDD